jgi:nucleoside-diphosphate-sugar epimerase
VSIRVAVVGGRGWLGREIVAVARSRGLVVTVVSRVAEEGAVAVDPADLPSLAAALGDRGDHAVVVNAAGRRLGPPALVHAANVALPERLGRLAAEGGWRLVHVGSAAEYGRTAAGPGTIAEDRRCEPVTTYARSKLAGTEAVTAWRDRGADAVVARVFNVVGPEAPADNPVHGLVRQALALVAAGGGEIQVGDPTTVRDLSTRRWVAEAVVALATGPAAAPAVVNVCSGRPTGFGELVGALAEVLDLKVRVRDLGWPRGGRIVGDPARLRSLVALPEPAGVAGLARSALGHDGVPCPNGGSR